MTCKSCERKLKCLTEPVCIPSRINSLRNITDIQCTKGNYTYDDYMRGMANGLILALSIMEDKDPKFL